MESLHLECLRCGDIREIRPRASRWHAGECARCGYVGWAKASELSERMRQTIRERPPELRRLRAVW
jgi:Zn ribbon nucleic-acid-binding protein